MTEKSCDGDGSGGGDGDPAEEEKNNNNADGGAPTEEEKEKEKNGDPELLICLLQPAPADSDPDYIGIRRLLLSRKPQSPFHRRRDWRCNGKGYVAFRNYIRRPRNWERMQTPSLQTTPGNSGRWILPTSPLSLLYDVESWSPGRDVQSGSQPSPRRSFGYSISDSDGPGPRRAEPAYSFVGMHCIFDQCKASVTVLKFGHMSSDLLAYGASDGTLTVCTVSDPPSILKHLHGHSKDVTDFDFSSNNQYIASSSMDKTVRVWEISKGLCIRVIYGVSPQLCIRFHPVNNNFLSAGNADKEVTVFNFSTGRVIHKIFFDSEVTSMDYAHTGQLIFCGDAMGCIYSISMNSHTGMLSRSHRYRSSTRRKSAVITVQYRSFSLLARGPVLLTCTQDGSLSFFSVALEIQGYLTLRCSLKLNPRIYSIRASFCPLLSLEKGEYIVSGSEDSNVYFYDLTRPKHTCVNKLQGHRFPVIGVAWNHGENLLASSDFYGTVIVWKRSKTG
ncbi:WD repeat-containing protein 13-like [Pyrus ussuriensis x Pyrus communis]|uniref:WD repeat-containing protein 13-like n=1 Tax=Pyrus ussuriensis x Pyrus communis TaxID=2448454 RepID=A0A5N5FPL2_9ROSA|nr:WD repeat-containing protein 13-like [Pyrus ussuriensis x Pyrus communis]